ncbi:XdhC family protein [Mucilaginibacter myungsuensis]|uniref:XdhC family protein n=1 Tax=Mucilaginibacter myungsuensis TaxID=649104 RepID=A0A929PW98_9SPHI|nr:XdhC/CoxI family protein [Mucilaginibacter myungsuensis]MBE9662613.1 XdhC family protein [Mucilaginibacter myungsuensis]MDN3598033.1 XdhC family protein [Mucilaginibacter myungsuensis]
MSELQPLLAAYDAERKLGRPCALATVVEVNGSAYRRPGARMLITNDGQLNGTISGGCLEGDARRRAQQVMFRGKPEIVVYDSTDIEEDLEHGAQLGCQGQIFILLEPIDFNDEHNPLELLREVFLLQQPSLLATVLKSDSPDIARTGDRALLLNDGSIKNNALDQTFGNNHLIPDMAEVLADGISEVKDYRYAGSHVRVFLELIKPSPILTIYGAGNDAQPLVQLAVRLGWRVSVVDGRPQLVTEHRFPGAEWVQVARLEELPQHVIPQGLAVLMSHNYFYDMAVLQQLSMLQDISYIGILGPRKKTDRILGELEQQGINTAVLDERIYSPIGLDIGGENADEIALSIMAELQAVRNGFKGGSLRDLKAPIHNRDLNIKALTNG